MQYLSKAYNYYSEGTVTLSSSPFHVRFGKLQVLRAAEKTVTIRLPNNLPAPHIAPFVMKVGETGEAFFVVETDEQVPADLLTSPVVMPTQTDLPSTHVDHEEEDIQPKPHHHSLTQEPFGETEKRVQHEEPLGDVDFLDLDASSSADTPPKDSPNKRSSLVHSASSLLPNIPFLSSPSNSRSGSPPKDDSSKQPANDEAKAKAKDEPMISTTNQQPNPLTTKPGESSDMPERDHTLSSHDAKTAERHEAGSDGMLPRVEPGQGEGPPILYGRDVVLDMAGYHSAKSGNPGSPSSEDSDPQSETFIQDLLAAVQLPDESRPALPASRLTDSELPSGDPDDTPLPSPAPEMASDPDLPGILANVHLTPQSISRRFDRGHSEPPQDINSDGPRSPTRTAMDMQWDWGRRHGVEMGRSRSGTLPENPAGTIGRLKNVEENPYMFVLELQDHSHHFELSIAEGFSEDDEAEFTRNRITFQKFIEDPQVVDDPRLIVKYNSIPSLPALSDVGMTSQPPDRPSSGYGWSRWWRRGQSSSTGAPAQLTRSNTSPINEVRPLPAVESEQPAPAPVDDATTGADYCRSDALGHVFAAIGRDWTHLGIAKLYTDVCNNGYKMLYLTSRAIGQADATRQYLKTIIQGEYRLPEGPVIMSPDRLMASLHREVIMRKPELFKMACLRDIQRLFGEQAKEAFFAGFGNRITDAMSYRSVGIPAAKIYTIDSTGVVKTELLSAAGHTGSYIQLVFPPVSTKFKPEYTDFNYWRDNIADIPIPDLSPPSPALSARSDTSGRLSVLGKIAGIGRRGSKQPLLPTSEPSSRPSSPLFAPSMTPDDFSEGEGDDDDKKSQISMPGSFDDEDQEDHTADTFFGNQNDLEAQNGNDDSFDDDANFDDDILAAGEMQHVPF
ncbi:uncharacterized protein IL334_007811 [Kwoniella shivajii]|uniref:phosphatidate phosphatase n=1 Tax=Kwoniella shivajii TaxID=564305 RepID=A0ABZ1DDL9_9TREE|nr:hypothetical protein IL334_007811 [Kwoniella shivajii]